MPRRNDRPRHLTETAIDLLGRQGVHGLTHRTLDAAAHVPEGTTSRYFRTRAALLLAVAEAVLERHLRDLEDLAAQASGAPIDVGSALAWLMSRATQENRTLYLARAELALEATRLPELRDIMAQIRTTSLDAAGRLLRAAGVTASASRIDVLGSALAGITLDRIVLGRPEADDAAIGQLLARLLDEETASPRS